MSGMMNDPRVHEYRAALTDTNKGLSAPADANERYRKAIVPYLECVAEHTPDGIARQAMIAELLHDGFSLGLVAGIFRASEEEIAAYASGQPVFEEEPNDEIARLQQLPYRAYLKTAHWQKVRTEALKRAENRCALCNTTEHLQVHHRYYGRKGFERAADVTVLCDSCHDKHHGLKAA